MESVSFCGGISQRVPLCGAQLGPYKLIAQSLRFELFCKLLVRGVERFYPPPDGIAVFVSPNSVIY
jgi:hypothetical protein